jgi:hypothetical protein
VKQSPDGGGGLLPSDLHEDVLVHGGAEAAEDRLVLKIPAGVRWIGDLLCRIAFAFDDRLGRRRQSAVEIAIEAGAPQSGDDLRLPQQ